VRITFNYTDTSNNKLYRKKYPIFGEFEENIIYTFSGKTSLSIILDYFLQAGKLNNKMGQMLVPSWLGAWVYKTMQGYCFPTLSLNNHTRGVFVYHQWGFPQRMDEIIEFCKKKDIFVIEDCAHAFDSQYKGKMVGTYGDASIFSFSKYFSSVVGGAIYTENDDMKKQIKEKLKKDDNSLLRKAFRHRMAYDKNPTRENQIGLGMYYAVYNRILKCPYYSLSVVKQQIVEKALEKRRKNHKYFIKELKQYMDIDGVGFLDDQGVTPWVTPLFFSKRIGKKVVEKLIENEIESGSYNFDINRNILNPNFVECVIIPCHHGMSNDNISQIMDIIFKVLKYSSN